MRILYKYLTTSLFPRHMEPEVAGLGLFGGEGGWVVLVFSSCLPGTKG